MAATPRCRFPLHQDAYTLQRAETATEPPNLRLLVACAVVMGVPLEQLFDDDWLRFEPDADKIGRSKGERVELCEERGSRH